MNLYKATVRFEDSGKMDEMFIIAESYMDAQSKADEQRKAWMKLGLGKFNFLGLETISDWIVQ